MRHLGLFCKTQRGQFDFLDLNRCVADLRKRWTRPAQGCVWGQSELQGLLQGGITITERHLRETGSGGGRKIIYTLSDMGTYSHFTLWTVWNDPKVTCTCQRHHNIPLLIFTVMSITTTANTALPCWWYCLWTGSMSCWQMVRLGHSTQPVCILCGKTQTRAQCKQHRRWEDTTGQARIPYYPRRVRLKIQLEPCSLDLDSFMW